MAQAENNPNPNPVIQPHIVLPPMNRSTLFIILAFLAGALLSFLFFGMNKDTKTTQKQTVSIIGTGEVKIPANTAMVYTSVNAAGNTEADARKKTSDAVADVKKKLTAAGISQSAIDAGEVYVNPPYNSYQKTLTPLPAVPAAPVAAEKVLGVRIDAVSNPDKYIGTAYINITLEKDDFPLTDKVISIFNDSTAGIVEGKPSYMVKGVKQYMPQAREKALLDAREQVEKIAKINNLRIVKTISIEDENTMKMQPTPYPMDGYGGAPYYAPIFPSATPDELYADPITKTANLTASYRVVYELSPSFFPF